MVGVVGVEVDVVAIALNVLASVDVRPAEGASRSGSQPREEAPYMLWSRSASLTRMTRASMAIERMTATRSVSWLFDRAR